MMRRMTHPIVIGITGNPGSGKDTLADILQRHFSERGLSAESIAPGDLVREYVREHHLGDPSDRETLRRAAQQVREAHGANFWLQHAIDKAAHADILLYPGMRHGTELELARKYHGIIVAIDAPQKLRYEWVRKRNRPGDDISFEQFTAQEEAERHSATHQVDLLMRAAHVRVENIGTLEQLNTIGDEIASHFPDHLATRYNAEKR
jgi:dephospho-CoA kinase